MQRLCGVVAAFVAKSKHPIYDRKAKCGVWRTILSRVNPAGDMLLMVQTTTVKEEDRPAFTEPLVAELAASGLNITSIFQIFNDEVTDAARPNAVVTHLHGKPRLEMPMLDLKLEIGPLLLSCAKWYLKLRKTDVTSQHVVIGVDIVEENIEDARRNAQQNSISNTEFIAGKAEEVVPKILGDMDTSLEVVAVVDPSRAGLHPRLVEILRGRTQVLRIVYISCNVESMAEDVAKLGSSTEEEADDFVPVRTVAVDSFPQTVHVEAIQLLERASIVEDPRKRRAAKKTAAVGDEVEDAVEPEAADQAPEKTEETEE
ncbi:trmt2b [Symbiodinium pilosum]|uniref:Trmt2b protein n=1 Tax=Symbiodinium pilosum TaxID=2952 RepID=A0A812T0Q0_SYMPI|nr:trmt2b [Symbiodinium pilosum]